MIIEENDLINYLVSVCDYDPGDASDYVTTHDIDYPITNEELDYIEMDIKDWLGLNDINEAKQILKSQDYRVVLNEEMRYHTFSNIVKFAEFKKQISNYFKDNYNLELYYNVEFLVSKYRNQIKTYFKNDDFEGAIEFIKNLDEFNESTITEAVNNPDEPASKKQLWALFCATKQDWRDKGLTKGEAYDLIQKYSKEKPINSNTSNTSLEKQIETDIIENLKPQLDKQMKKCFGLRSVVGDADLEGNLIPGGRRYKFFGAGCGFAWIKYDQRNKKLGKIIELYDEIYKNKFFNKFAEEYIHKYGEKELAGVLSQDIDIKTIIKWAELDFAKSIGVNTKGAYVDSRLD